MSHSDEPAAPIGAADTETDHTLHTHPVPRLWRIGALIYGAALLLFGLLILTSIVNGDRHDARQREAIRTEILAELDERTKARDAENAKIQRQIDAQNAATRLAVCGFLAEGDPTPAVLNLGSQFQCPGFPPLPERTAP